MGRHRCARGCSPPRLPPGVRRHAYECCPGPSARGASGLPWACGSGGVWAWAAPRPRSSPLRAWLSRERLALPFGLSPLALAWSRELRASLCCVSAGCTVGRRFSVRAGAACLLVLAACSCVPFVACVPVRARVCPRVSVRVPPSPALDDFSSVKCTHAERVSSVRPTDSCGFHGEVG